MSELTKEEKIRLACAEYILPTARKISEGWKDETTLTRKDVERIAADYLCRVWLKGYSFAKEESK